VNGIRRMDGGTRKTRHLVLGDAWLIESEGITYAIHPPRAEGAVLTPEREWEAFRIAPLTVMEDEGCFRMWYSSIAGHAGQAMPLSCPRWMFAGAFV